MKSLIQKIFVLTLVMAFGLGSPLTSYAQIGGAVSGALGGSVNIQGVGPILLSCLAQEMGPLGGGSSPFGGGADAVESAGEIGGIEGGDGINAIISPETAGSIQSVPVSDAVVQADTEKIKDNSKDIKIEEEKDTRKERCEDKIARFIALEAMDKITFATLEWINSGFEGKPFFVENPEQFFSDLATDELLGFSAIFTGDENLYPFGETIVRTVFLSFQQSFQQNMVNSLNNVLAHGTREEWSGDFSVGGWAGYTAYVEPNNNIFGSYIESSRNLGNKLNGTRVSKAINVQAELQQGLGFLSQRSCAETEGGGSYIPENSIQHIKVGVSHITQINQIPTNVYTYITACEADDVFDEDGDGEADSDGLCEGFDEDIIAVAEDFRGRSICTRWKTNTPGNQIAEQVTRAVGASQEQNLLVDELNESLGLLLDALLNQFITQGLSSFYEPTGNYTEDNVAWAQVNGLNPGEPQDSIPFIDAMNGGGQGNESFEGIVPLQEQYIQGATTLVTLYGEIVQRTRDLDYCVPGPNPGWQTHSANAIADYFSLIPAYESLPQASWTGSTPAGISDLTESISNFSLATDQEGLNEYINLIYSFIIEVFTGVSLENDELNPEILNRTTQFLPVLYGAFSEYAGLINERFMFATDFSGNLRNEAANFFFTLDETQASIAQYSQNIEQVSDILQTLIDLREEYADIEHEYILGVLTVAVNNQGFSGLADNLATFQSFSPAEVTYIGTGGQNSAYHNAVTALTAELGEPVLPPTSHPEYSNILEEFVELIPNTATEDYVDALDNEIEDAIEMIGDISNGDSLIGLTYSCLQQVNEFGPYQNIPFAGYTERKPYPFPISTEIIPGVPFSSLLSTTETFLEDLTVGPDINDITISLTPLSAVDEAEDLGVFESMFINLGDSLY